MKTKNVKILGSTLFVLALCVAPAWAQLNYNFNDNAVPPGTTASGVARVADNVLHLTDAGQAGVNGVFVIPDPAGGKRVGNLHVHWKSKIGGGGGGGADGYSFNWGTDLATGGVGEEGTGTGLSVTIDTFDNGGGETGIEIKWGGPDHNSAIGAARIAFTPIAKDDPGTGVFLRKDQFVDADLVVDNNSCRATFIYDGQTVSADLPGYSGFAGGNFVFGARTGGANDNQWLDDVRIDAGITEIVALPLIAPANTSWAYNESTTTTSNPVGTPWTQPTYDTNSLPGWKTGLSLFGNDAAGIYDLPNQPFAGMGTAGFLTPLDRSNGRISFYFRTKFNWSGPTAGVSLTASNWVDDGLVAYLNGVEVSRIRVPDAPAAITWDTLGVNPPTEGAVEVRTWDASALVQGENTLAVEVHQSSTGSSDVAFALGLSAVMPLAPTILDCTQPTNRLVFANRTTTLSAVAIGSPALSYQWYKDGAPIPNATSADYVIAQMAATDAGNYFCRLSNAIGTADTRTARVDYLFDDTPPELVAANGSSTFDRVTVQYNELMDPATAVDSFNYIITDSGGTPLTITGVTLNSDGASVTISVQEALVQGAQYTVAVSSVADRIGNVIVPASASFTSFVPGCGGLIFEAYNTGAGNAVSQLTGHSTFPNSPDFVATIAGFDSRLAYPTDAREAYGARVRGLYVPPYSGEWVFYLRSDDASELWLNPNGPDPAGKRKIQEETTCCRAFEALPTAAFQLVGGKPYYIEGLYKEGTGGDYIQVAARVRDSSETLVPIPGRDVGQFAVPGAGGALTITQQPADVTTLANTLVSFSVAIANPSSLPVCYQWRRNGADIAGANGATYSFGPVSPAADNGATFDCVVSIVGAVTTTRQASLTVNQDVTPPIATSASAGLNLTSVSVTFSEFVDPATASDGFNYAVAGFGVTSAQLNPDGKTATVTLDGTMALGTSYQIDVQNVTDLSGNPMNPTTLNFRTASISDGFLVLQVYRPESTSDNNIDTTLLADPHFPSVPSEVRYMSAFDTRTVYPDDSHEGYGGLILGYFVPPTSGNWIFYLRSDDSSRLYLNPTGTSPAGKVLLTEETACCLGFSAHASAPQALTAGQKYYIEALYKEGTGGDYCQVAAKLDTDPSNPDALRPIPGAYLSGNADPTGATISITQQPTDQVFVVTPDTLLDETFNSGNGGFTVDTPLAFDGPWMYDSASGSWHADGQSPEDSHANTSYLISPAVTVTRTGPVTLTFEHRYSFEYDGTRWDGGQVQLSVNGSPFAAVPPAAFTQNGYGGNTIAPGSAATLAGQPAFTAESANYATAFITSRATGNFNAGDTIRIRFAYSADTNTRGAVPNWQIDHVVLSMGGGAQPVTFSVAATASKTPVLYQWYRDSGSGFVAIPTANGSSFSILPVCGDNGAKFRVSIFIPGASVVSQTAMLTVTQPNTAPRFAVTPPSPVNEDSGAQAVPNTLHDVVAGTAAASAAAPKIGINFAADEANGSASGTLAATDKAGVVPQIHWNNTTGASGSSSGLVADYANNSVSTLASVTWASPNTWSSTGRGEENNGFPAGGDHTMMTGYLDTGDALATGLSVTVNGLGSEFTSGGYDVIVYALGGVAGRGGAYTIGSTTKYATGPTMPTAHSEDAGVDLTDTGTFVRFNGLSGSSFTLTANASAPDNPANTVNFRAPVNGIQIVAHQSSQIPIFSYNANFDSGLPAGTTTSGTTPPVVDAGHLVLTRNGALSEQDFWQVPLSGVPVLQTFHASWKSLINGPGGADGYSFNFGQNVGTGFTAEEGGSSGLSVTLDTYDNGGGEVGIETRWNGSRLSFTPIGGGTVHGPPELSKNQFVNATVDVTPSGQVTFNYDGFVTVGQIPSYAGISGNQLVFAARTGGASEDAFIDDLSLAGFAPGACGDESGQTVHFTVSNDNPSLFSAQPAIGGNGTLTYTPAANASGVANVTVVAQDSGGTLYGGSDTSAPQTFAITVNAVNDCPTATGPSGTLTVISGGSVPVPLTASDIEGDPLTAGVVTGPGHGTLSGTGLNVTYTANAGYVGPDSFTLAVTDGQCTSAGIPVSVNVLTRNHPPSCLATLGPDACILHFPGDTKNYVLSIEDHPACVVLDGSSSSDPDGDSLSYLWSFGPFTINMDASQEPSGGGTGTGSGTVSVSGNTLTVNITFSGLTAPATAAHFHAVGGTGTNAGVIYPLNVPNATSGTISQTVTLVEGTRGYSIAQQIQQLRSGLWYANIHSSFRPGGEIRGQVVPPPTLSGATVVQCFPLGCHTADLEVSDGIDHSDCSVDVCVISASEAVEQCAALVDSISVDRKNKRPLIASLKAASASFERGSFDSGLNQLHAFQNKCRAQIGRSNPAEAQALIDCAQKISDAIACQAIVAGATQQ